MPETQSVILGILENAVEGLRDRRAATAEELQGALWLLVYGQNVLSQVGRDFRGLSFRQDESSCLMVVKSRLNGTQQVAFTTARTPMDCMRVFRRRFEEDTVCWHDDKYA